MMEQKPKKIFSVRVFTGKLINLDVDQIIDSHSSQPVRREVVRHPGAAAIIPCLPGAEVVLVRQYRYPIDKWLWEIPAGLLEPNEKPEDCAARELIEETGYKAGKLNLLATLHSSPGFSDEVLYLFFADKLKLKGAKPDLEENIEVKIFSILEVLEMIASGEIVDSKTVSGILLVAHDIYPVTDIQ